jgi:hypothetical protein
MSKTRNVEIKNREGFTQVSNNMLSDPNISYKAKGILCHLLSHDQDRFTITSETLIRHSSDGGRAIKSGLDELKKNGYLQITREAGDKGRWKYILNMFGNKFTHTYKTTEWAKTDRSVSIQCNNKNTNLKNTKKEKECEEKQRPIVNNQVIPEIKDEIEEEAKRLIEESNQLAIKLKQPLTHTELSHTPTHKPITVEELQIKSNDLLQKIGFGFTKNPRQIMDAIYRQLPPDYMVKEDMKDVDAIQQAINKFDSAPASERDAVSKRLYQAIEGMAKLYLIKKHGEEFRDQLYPKVLNDNLTLYIGANPTLSYCLKGFSNDIDGVYNEIVRLTKKKRDKEQREWEEYESRRIERERIKAEALSRPHYTDEQIHAMGLRTVPEILRSMDSRGSDIDHLDAKYSPIDQTITEEERTRLQELLTRKMTKQPLTPTEEGEYVRLDRKLRGK